MKDKESGIELGIESILHQSKLKTEVQKLFRKLPPPDAGSVQASSAAEAQVQEV